MPSYISPVINVAEVHVVELISLGRPRTGGSHPLHGSGTVDEYETYDVRRRSESSIVAQQHESFVGVFTLCV